MSDLTVYAEALIATVARAFYDDDAVILIDVLIRDKFLRDDDMAPRLQLPAKKLRETLRFLQDEQLVKEELVDDLAQGGSQQTKFWYIDYNHAVHTIRLRLHLLRKDIEQAEMQARTSSYYLCPGYNIKRCNGRYTEEEAQQVIDPETGLFLCQECYLNFQNDPVMSEKKEEYTLQLIDNTKDLKLAIDNMRRVNVQLSGKMIGSQQLRAGVYDLLQKVRGKGKDPITSNLPSENFALGRGSKRLAGTGRTAGIRARKLEQQGVNAARDLLVGGGKRQGMGDLSDLTFLKNALGNEIAFAVEKGGGARANLLSQRHPNPNRKRQKLMDSAATRVATTIPPETAYQQKHKEEMEKAQKAKEQEKAEETSNGKKKLPGVDNMDWLNNNITRGSLDMEMERLRKQDMEAEGADDDDNLHHLGDHHDHGEEVILACDDDMMTAKMDENTRKATFQALYSKEMARQAELLKLENDAAALTSPRSGGGAIISQDDESVTWEDA